VKNAESFTRLARSHQVIMQCFMLVLKNLNKKEKKDFAIKVHLNDFQIFDVSNDGRGAACPPPPRRGLLTRKNK
jgi:hypothetical protein